MTQDDWFNIIFPIVLILGSVGLTKEYFQEKRYHQELEKERLQIKKEKDALKKEISDFNEK